MKYKQTEEDKRWQAENDLRTLRDAEKIRNDKMRMGGVVKAAKELQKIVNPPARVKPTKASSKKK